MARQLRIAEEVVDPGAERKNQFEIGQRGQKPGLGPPHQRVVDFRPVADFGPQADFELLGQPAEL